MRLKENKLRHIIRKCILESRYSDFLGEKAMWDQNMEYLQPEIEQTFTYKSGRRYAKKWSYDEVDQELQRMGAQGAEYEKERESIIDELFDEQHHHRDGYVYYQLSNNKIDKMPLHPNDPSRDHKR